MKIMMMLNDSQTPKRVNNGDVWNANPLSKGIIERLWLREALSFPWCFKKFMSGYSCFVKKKSEWLLFK